MPFDPGDQDKPARDALALNGHSMTRTNAGMRPLCSFPGSPPIRPIENNTGTCYLHPKEVAMFFRFPPDAHWNPERSAVEFGIGVGEYDGTVSVSRRAFQHLLGDATTPQRCLEAYHLHRTRLELIAERKVRRRQLTEDAN